MSFGPNANVEILARPAPDPVETAVPFAFIHINKCGGSSIEIALGLPKTHDTALARRAAMGREAWDRTFTFATVRNPFERVVSIYYYRVATDQGWPDGRPIPLEDWVHETFALQNPRYWVDSPLLWPAADWLCQDGAPIVDHVARLEDIAVEWPMICQRLGIDRDLGVYNANPHPPHGAVLSARARATIEEVFAEDLDRFGYRFNPD